MKTDFPKPLNLAYRSSRFVLPVIALGTIYYLMNELPFSLVAS